MTTERSGMSLDRIAEGMRGLAKVIRQHGTCAPMALEKLADAIDDHLSRDAVVSDEDVSRACETFDPVGWKVMGGDSRADFKASVRRILESFAARHAAVPDEMDAFASQPEGLNYADGWNACREAMLAQRDGG